MALPNLLNVPMDERGFNDFAFHNDDLHQRIIEAIKVKYNISLTRYILNPIPISTDPVSWSWRHQQTHNDMNGVLGIQGSDLTDVNWRDEAQRDSWIRLHFSEMYQAATILGVG